MSIYGHRFDNLIESKFKNIDLEDTSKVYSAGHPKGQNRMDEGKASKNDKIETDAQKEYQQRMKVLKNKE